MSGQNPFRCTVQRCIMYFECDVHCTCAAMNYVIFRHQLRLCEIFHKNVLLTFLIYNVQMTKIKQ